MVWKTSSDRFASVLSLILLGLVFSFPFITWSFLWRKAEFLNQQESLDKYGSTYNEIRTNSKAALMYNVLYMLRRLWITGIVILIKKDSYL